MVQGFLELISDVSDEYGNTIDGKGRDFFSPTRWRPSTRRSTTRVARTSRSSCIRIRRKNFETSSRRPSRRPASTQSSTADGRSGVLRDVVGTFLDTLTEREFDGPLLALLAARGFTDVHFIHGAFEFGKDVLAKRADPDTGEGRQYVIQSKAGDIGQPEWRAVRPQLEECEYNTIGHPSFDADLPRVAVLVTTGRLKGAAPADVTECRKSVEAGGLADLEIWEKSDLVDWLCNDPTAGITGEAVQVDLLSLVTSVLNSGVTDRRIEVYTRRWLPPTGRATRAAVEAAILVNALLRVKRIDLAMSVALQLVRATEHDPAAPEGSKSAARRLILSLAALVLHAGPHRFPDHVRLPQEVAPSLPLDGRVSVQ
jgi:hypothetical protein